MILHDVFYIINIISIIMQTFYKKIHQNIEKEIEITYLATMA